MFSDTRPAGLSDDGLDEFRVDAPAEIAVLLRQLQEHNTVLSLSAPDGSAYASTLWTVDTAMRKLSFSADAGSPQVQALIDAGEATAVGYLESIKLQFELQELMLVHGNRSCALQTALPLEMFRFQRRNSFRVRLLPRGTPVARLRHPSLPDMPLALRVLDVSMGGCALFLPEDVPPLQPGTRLQGVQIELDTDTRFSAVVQLEHVTMINPQSGGSRLGCSLGHLSGDAQRALQRYIDHTQKRRRLLSLD